MPAAKKKAPSASADSASNAKKKLEPTPFVTDDAGKAFTHFLPLAEALPPDDVIVRGADVRAIRSGKGKIDIARDCIDITGIFHEAETKLAGKHPFTIAQLDDLAKTGTWLVQTLKPGNTKKTKQPRSAEADIRDRFWTLVEDRHDTLRTVGVALFGIKHINEYVPPLFSRVSSAKPAEAPSAEPSGKSG